MIKKEEILSTLEEMKGRLNDLSSSDKLNIENLHPIVLRRQFTRTGCGDCYRDAVIQMTIYLQKNEIMEKKSSYILKAGVVIAPTGDTGVYNNFNITDKVAEAFLKSNPKAIGQFESYPEDWEERIKETIKKELTPEEIAAKEAEERKEAEEAKAAKEKFEAAEKLFIELLAGKLKEGVTKTALKEEYKEHEIDGKKVTQRSMADYLKMADELNVVIDTEKGKE